MELGLREAASSLSGGGMDDVGRFSIAGSRTAARVTWIKRYATHAVDYSGDFDGHFIRGTWRLEDGFTGSFCLWPDGADAGVHAVEEKSDARPEPAGRR